MKKNLMSLALIALASTFTYAAPVASAPAATPQPTVTVSGASATEAAAPMLTMGSAKPVEASFGTMLPVVQAHPSWVVTAVKTKNAQRARLALKSTDGVAKLEMDIAEMQRVQQHIKAGDTLNTAISQNALVVFSKNKVPLGFLVKPGLPVASLKK